MATDASLTMNNTSYCGSHGNSICRILTSMRLYIIVHIDQVTYNIIRIIVNALLESLLMYSAVGIYFLNQHTFLNPFIIFCLQNSHNKFPLYSTDCDVY